MEITQADLRIGDCTNESIGSNIKHEKNEDQASEYDTNDCYSIVARDKILSESCEQNKNYRYVTSITNIVDPNLNSVQHDACTVSDILTESIYFSSLDSELLNEEINRRMNQATEGFVRSDEQLQTCFNISGVSIPSDILEELSLSIKKENDFELDWVHREDVDIAKTRIIRSRRSKRDISGEVACNNYKGNENKSKRVRRRRSRRTIVLQDYRERLRKKAECMREKRKKLYEQESQEQRLQRLAKEAAKRREMRMYYETPEQRRKRLDAEAARKREYRMYNETPDERRKRLDREAERRRVKRLTMYASETPEQRRERLNKESAKRREARLNQYAKETEEQRQERLRKDALRAREMRFTRSAIETEEERRQRLVKDALRKRELRMHGGTSVSNFTELQTVRSFEELNNVQMKDDPDNQLGGHYLSNWMMWFQNTLTQPANSGEPSNETEQQTDV